VPIQIASLFAKIGADTSELNTALKNTGQQLRTAGSQMKEGFGGATGAINLLKTVAGAFIVREGIKMISQLAEMGAEAERTENSFIKVSGGAGDAARNLDILRTATRNARSDVELMAGATNILALGLADNADDLGNIVRNVEALGSRFGGTMQIFQLMMSNQSLMRIDSFGIGVEEATNRIDEFKQAGMNAQDAFKAAILELMTEKFEDLGGAVDDAKLAMEQAEAASKNLKTEAGRSFLGLGAAIKTSTKEFNIWATGILRNTNDLREEFGYFEGTFRGIMDMFGAGKGPVTDWAKAVEKAGKQALPSLTGAMYAVSADAMQALADGLGNIGDAAGEAAPPVQANASAVAAYQMALAGIDITKMQDYTQYLKDSGEAAANAHIAFLNVAASIGEMGKAQLAQLLLDQLKDAGLSGEALAKATETVLIQMGLLTGDEQSIASTLQTLSQGFVDSGGNAAFLRDMIFLIKYGIENLPKYTKLIIEIEERRKISQEALGQLDWQSMWQGQTPTPAPISAPATGGTGGTQSGTIGSTWTGDININGAMDASATANAVIQKLADRGIIRTGGYR